MGSWWLEVRPHRTNVADMRPMGRIEENTKVRNGEDKKPLRDIFGWDCVTENSPMAIEKGSWLLFVLIYACTTVDSFCDCAS